MLIRLREIPDCAAALGTKLSPPNMRSSPRLAAPGSSTCAAWMCRSVIVVQLRPRAPHRRASRRTPRRGAGGVVRGGPPPQSAGEGKLPLAGGAIARGPVSSRAPACPNRLAAGVSRTLPGLAGHCRYAASSIHVPQLLFSHRSNPEGGCNPRKCSPQVSPASRGRRASSGGGREGCRRVTSGGS